LITRPDGKSKGLAFVKFSRRSSLNKAFELNGIEHLGRNIKVEESLGKKENNGFNKGGNDRPANGGAYNRAPEGTADIQTETLFIGGISYNSDENSIREYFSKAGDVKSARIVTDK
jgi:nucleolin